MRLLSRKHSLLVTIKTWQNRFTLCSVTICSCTSLVTHLLEIFLFRVVTILGRYTDKVPHGHGVKMGARDDDERVKATEKLPWSMDPSKGYWKRDVKYAHSTCKYADGSEDQGEGRSTVNGDFYAEKWLEGVMVKRKLVSDDCIIGLVLLERVEVSFSTRSVTSTFHPSLESMLYRSHEQGDLSTIGR